MQRVSMVILGFLGSIALVRGADSVVVDTEFVAKALARNAIVWDVRGEDDYRRGHIPGAVNLGDIQAELRDGNTEDYLPVAQLEKILGDHGIDPGKEIVLYGAKAMPQAYFGHVTLRYLGATQAYVYHGGIDDWKAAGRETTTQTSTLPSIVLKAKVNSGVLVSTQEVLRKTQEGNVQIVDARSSKEYNGEDIRALRGGRIPGAVNIPYETNWVDADTPRKLQRKLVANKDGMNLKDEAELKRLYAGLDPNKETIVYCQSGSRASETATVLQNLGFKDVKVYDSSWLAWGNEFSAPVESATYFNVGRVNNMLNQLQGRVDALEAELEQLKQRKQ
ncbi:MAG: sulfurtransferase [Burkholderiales bacterium]